MLLCGTLQCTPSSATLNVILHTICTNFIKSSPISTPYIYINAFYCQISDMEHFQACEKKSNPSGAGTEPLRRYF